MKRCAYCHRRIWPWQRRGWYVRPFDTAWWHGKCHKLTLTYTDWTSGEPVEKRW